MDPEVIFILVLIVFSILEGAVRKKKSGRGSLPGGVPQPPPGWPEPGRFPGGEDRRADEAGGGVTVAEATGRAEGTAEGMVPEDVWEEIAALARGDVDETLRKRRERKRDAPLSQPETPREASSRSGFPHPPAQAGERGPARSRVPRTRDPRPRTFGPSTPVKRPPLPDPVDAAGEGVTAPTPPPPERVALRHRRQIEAPKVRKTHAVQHHGFRGPHVLRHAFVAREVLGRPAALREYGEDDLWSS